MSASQKLKEAVRTIQGHPKLTLGQKAFAINLLRNNCKPKRVYQGIAIATRYINLVTHPNYSDKKGRATPRLSARNYSNDAHTQARTGSES